MNETIEKRRWRPSPVGLVAGALVIGGFLLAEIDWGFLAISGLGTFGPGILRELGVLRDKDEFQMRATRKAGYHAFLATGLVLFLMAALFRSRGETAADPGPVVETALAVLWFTWLLSSLLSYWGPRRTAVRILVIFGSVWLVFIVLSNTGGEWQGLTGLLVSSLMAAPFFALAWAAPRWPRIAGLLLLACAGFAMYFFGLYEIVQDPLAMGRAMVLIFFVGPLLASGIALLGRRAADDGD